VTISRGQRNIVTRLVLLSAAHNFLRTSRVIRREYRPWKYLTPRVHKRTTARFGRCFYERSVMARPSSLDATHIVPVSGRYLRGSSYRMSERGGVAARQGWKKVPRNAIDMIHRGVLAFTRNFYVLRVRKDSASTSPSTSLGQNMNNFGSILGQNSPIIGTYRDDVTRG